MAEHFLKLSTADRRDVLAAAQVRTGRNQVVLEKDVWLCWTLAELFTMPNGPRMVFKGGTSLSKVFNLISRFSEDVDVTLDYRHLLPGFDPFAAGVSKTKIKRYSDELREAVGQQVATVIAPYLQSRATTEFGANHLVVDVLKDGDWIEKAVVRYPTVAEGKLAYISPAVVLEFGGRNVTEPSQKHRVTPDIAAIFTDLDWPEAQVEVLDPQRTFWEKATLMHVECCREAWKNTGERFARHWYDLVQLADSDIGRAAVLNRALAADVATHKTVFFAQRHVNYGDAVSGRLRLVPGEEGCSVLSKDYDNMVNTGFFFREPPAFDEVIARLRALEREINQVRHGK